MVLTLASWERSLICLITSGSKGVRFYNMTATFPFGEVAVFFLLKEGQWMGLTRKDISTSLEACISGGLAGVTKSYSGFDSPCFFRYGILK